MKNKLKKGECFVVVTERDCLDPFDSHGPIILETFIRDSNAIDAIEKAKALGNKYGKVIICKLEVVGDIELTNQMIK